MAEAVLPLAEAVPTEKRKRGDNEHSVSTSFNTEVHAELMARAESNDRTIAQEVRRAVKFYLANTDSGL